MVSADIHALFIEKMIKCKDFEFNKTFFIPLDDFLKSESIAYIYDKFGADVLISVFKVDSKKIFNKNSLIQNLRFDGSDFYAEVCILDVNQLSAACSLVEENADTKLFRRSLKGEAVIGYIVYVFHRDFPPHVCKELKAIAVYAVDICQETSGENSSIQQFYEEIMQLGELLKGDE